MLAFISIISKKGHWGGAPVFFGLSLPSLEITEGNLATGVETPKNKKQKPR